MKLKYKLTAFTIFALLAPMLVISIYAGSLLFRNISLAQWTFLQSVSDKLERVVREEEESYKAKLNEIANSEYLQDKLYVYSKYWEKISPATLEFDLYPFQDFVHNNILFSDIDSVLIFRKSGNKFIKVVGRGPTVQLPETLYQEAVQQHYSTPQYFRSSNGIFFQYCRPFFSSGRIVGLVILQKALDAGFLYKIASRFGVEVAVLVDGNYLFNSLPSTKMTLSRMLTSDPRKSRLAFDSNNTHYHGIVRPFVLGSAVAGTLVLYATTDNVVHQSFTMVRKISVVSLVCILIPVTIFALWGSGLVRSIHSILRATNEVALGDLDHRVHSVASDEIGLLASNFNKMVQKLKIGRTALESRNKELQLKNTYIDAVFQSLMIDVYVMDATNRIVAANRGEESEHRFTGDPTGRNIFEIGEFESRKSELMKVLEAVRQTGEAQHITEMELGGVRYEIDLFPTPAGNAEAGSIVMIMVNITDKLETERALNRSEKLAAVGQIAAGLAHEINNPMGIILNHVQLIESGRLTEAERKVFVGRVKSEIMRISKLIEKLLKFSKEETAPQELDYLSAIAVDVLDLFEPRMKSVSEVDGPCALPTGAQFVGQWNVQLNGSPTRVCLSRPEDEPPIFCDRNALQQVLINLLSNSFKSIHHRSGIIHMNVQSSETGVELSVRDNGEGIPEEYLTRIFDPFYTSNHETGTGLGLSLCQKIMKNHCGSMTVSSKANEGTEVKLSFPRGEPTRG